MRRTCCVARAGLVALLAMLALLGLTESSFAAQGSPEGGTKVDSSSVLLARGAGYADHRTSRDVRALQRSLRKLGWQPGPVDGLFGPLTEAAVVRAQRAAGLAPDGIFGPQTARALESALRRPLRRGAGYRQPDGAPRVRALQARLRALGHEPGPVDGIFGPRTESAVKRLQRSGGVSADGVVRPATRKLLAGQGSAEGRERARSRPAPGTAPDRTRGAQAEPGQPRSGPGGDARIRKPSNEVADDAAQDSGGPDISLLLAGLALALALVLLVGALIGPVGPAHTLVPAGRRRRRARGFQVAETARAGHASVGHDEAAGFVAPPTPLRPPTDASRPRPKLAVRALGYVSVPETDSLTGPELRAQMEAIDRLCERRGWELLEVVRDCEETRGKAFERPGLGYALERMESGEASCLVVSGLRRLSRSVADLGWTLERIGRCGGRLVAIDLGIDTATPEGRKTANVLITVSSWERDRLAERTRKGLAAARASGAAISRPSVHDVPSLKEWICELRDSGLTLQAIADRLNEEGVPTLRGGAKWRPSSVQTAAGYQRPRRSPGSHSNGESANGRMAR